VEQYSPIEHTKKSRFPLRHCFRYGLIAPDLEVAVPNDHSLNDIRSIVEAFETLATRLDDLKVYHASNRAGPEIDARIDRARRLALRAAALARQLHS
jgi:hypothetical protein